MNETEPLIAIRARIEDAARRAGRRAGAVRLIAVSKNQPLAAVERVAGLGQRDFGESRMQEADAKIRARPDLTWHCIGHVQSNKTAPVARAFHWVHSIDSERVYRRIAGAAHEQGREVQALLQVNVAQDPAKQGVAPDALFALVERLLSAPCPGIRLRGLMTIGAVDATPSETRRVFAGLRALAEAGRARFGADAFGELSMGMSDDFEIAIEEGATLVRVGTALFGARIPG